MDKQLTQYLKRIKADLNTGKATEHTYRPALKELIDSLGTGINAINEPKHIKCGAPDLTVTKKFRQTHFVIGYIEAKDIGSNLDEEEDKEQLKERYIPSLRNLILTNYLEFRWYVEGKKRLKTRLGRVDKENKLTIDEKGVGETLRLITDFLAHKPEPISTAKELALMMAHLTHRISDVIIDALKKGEASESLENWYAAFQDTLIPDLKVKDFADMYAQTISYGLFAAICTAPESERSNFTRDKATHLLPRTNPFLRKFFGMIAGNQMDDEPYVGFVDDLTHTLSRTNIEEILADFGKRTRQQDPILHFYETFLAAYDPKTREMRGVYYTPDPVVSYIVRSVDYLLKERFGCSRGLADQTTTKYTRTVDNGNQVEQEVPKVLILDPACGTGTFLYHVINLIRERFRERGDAGMWCGYVKNQLLKRLFGFELLMAPYAMAHFKLGMQLGAQDLDGKLRKQWAYDFTGKDRLGIYLTNTLDEAERRAERMFAQFISREANAAVEVKRDLPIMVVLGNPPYSGHSANRSWKYVQRGDSKRKKKEKTFIGKLLLDYYQVDGEPLGEKNPKWLQDDYVKFIRWGQWRIERTGAGVLALITNHAYLDNPTFRGMRQQLMNSFSDIYILNLHGNAKKKEKCPDGSKDKNVFDIQQGVAIGIFIKDAEKKKPATVHHTDLWGIRESKDKQAGKYPWLYSHCIDNTKWETLTPRSPYYLFIPYETKLLDEYCLGRKITEIFPINSVGIVTARDDLTIKWSPNGVWGTVKDFISLPTEQAREKYNLGNDVRDWKVHLAQQDLKERGPIKADVQPLLYRPFDVRYTYYSGKTRGFLCMPRPEVMRHMLAGSNTGFITTRQTREKWDIFVTRTICGHKSCAAYDINSIFPLYLYPNPEKEGDLFANGESKHPNINPDFIKEIEDKLRLSFIPDGAGDLKKTFRPEDIFNYIYAVLHSPTYRSRYVEFLKIDFPRIPLTSSKALFRKLVRFGGELVALHLLEAPILEKPITRYPLKGDDVVEKGHPKYYAPGETTQDSDDPLTEGRIYISRYNPKLNRKGQYFEGIPPEVWEFHIGGYQVCEKWLKDRRGRMLSYDDKVHYQKIIVALKETIRIMDEIDAAIPSWPLP